MSKDTDYVATLIDFTVSADNSRIDLEACLEISDRINATKAECLQAIKTITTCIGKSNTKLVLNTIQLLETLCKNCNMRFLYELNNKKLVDALMKHLTRLRDKAKYKMKDTKNKDSLKAEVEDRILFLLQLWADTFMMHQAEFRNIHDAYRNLRKDGVMFPDRDVNQKFMINFQGQVSPVFLAMESNYIVPSNNQGGPVSDKRVSTQGNKPRPTEYQHEASNKRMNTLYDENDDDYDYSAYDGIQVTAEEVRILEKSMDVLREIERTAKVSTDMKGEVAKEVLSDLVHVHKRLKHYIKSEKFLNSSHRNEAIKLSHNLTMCLSAYKTKYYKLKEEGRRVKTEVDDDPTDKYDYSEYSGNIGKSNARMATEVDDGTRYRPNNDFGFSNQRDSTEKTAPKRLAPHEVWKSGIETEKKNLGHNPDLVDLLNTSARPTPTKPTTKPTQAPKEYNPDYVDLLSTKETSNKSVNKPGQPKFEERKDTGKTQGQKIVDDLLDLDFGSPTTGSQNSKNLIEDKDRENRKAVQAQPPQRNFHTHSDTSYKNESLRTAPSISTNELFDFKSVVTTGFTSPPKPGNGIPQPKFIKSPTAFTQPQFKKELQKNFATMADTHDDDDFFSDIANRKR